MYDLTGKRFGMVTVINRAGSDKQRNATWLCKCDCGNDVVLVGSRLRSGEVKSCGCLKKAMVKEKMTTHGNSKTRLYRVWAGIKSRCYNKNAGNYKYYGGKSVGMCDDWRQNYLSFEKWSAENGYDESAAAQECTLDRIDGTKDYCPENCRWANHIEQCNNQTSNKSYTYNGETHTMAEWARIFGIKYTTLKARIYKGMSFEDAVITPVGIPRLI